MTKIIDYLLNKIGPFLNFIFLHVVETVTNLYKARVGIKIKDLFTDFIVVTRSIAGYLILNMLVLLVFIFLPQGRDILLIVAEEVGAEGRYGNLFWMLVGLFCWSVVSEFACRYAIYVTDNSGKSITDERVHWRKALQNTYSTLSLLLPYVVIMMYYIINYLKLESYSESRNLWGYGLPIICIYIILKTVTEFYWRKTKTWLSLTDDENTWCSKLYGIYNDYVFPIRRPENFVCQERNIQEEFCESFLFENERERDNFPQNINKVHIKSAVFSEFELIAFDDTDGRNGSYRWIYRVPNHFFKSLHRQVAIIAGICLGFYILVAFFPTHFYQQFGAPGLLLFSFAGLGSIYIIVLFVDYAVFRSYKTKKHPKPRLLYKVLPAINLRATIILVLLASSYLDSDHPVRQAATRSLDDNRPNLKEHFNNWLRVYDDHKLYVVDSNNYKRYPILFVCAEGGASRTGAYTSMLLSTLQENYRSNNKVDIRKYIYAFSGVSGGSLGLSFFNARAYYSGENDSLVRDTKDFFNGDFLSPIVGKMFYGDVLSLFIPWHIETFDRAIALEKSWENTYKDAFGCKNNIFSSLYLKRYQKDHTYPALFVNTTQVETGTQCWLCNVKPENSMYNASDRDLIGMRLEKHLINYSTMINFSTRFPLFSPGACVVENECQKRHYVDGGYVENSGGATMKEILVALKPEFDSLLKDSIIIEPYVIMIRFGKESDDIQTINFANEVSEIIFGIYNTRVGRTNLAAHELREYTKMLNSGNEHHFINLTLEMNNNEVPMNWVFSTNSLNHIKMDVEAKWDNRLLNDLRFLPWTKKLSK